MSIEISAEMRNMLDKRRAEKAKMYKDVTMTGNEVHIPTTVGSIRCLVYRPTEHRPSPLPVFFDLHGGGFNAGELGRDEAFCRFIADALGICVIGIDYPLAPEHPYPEEKEASYEVIRYVAQNWAQFGISPNRMAVGGHSSGANIATVIAMMAAARNEFSLRCQILDYPPTDICTPASQRPIAEGPLSASLMDMFNTCYRTPEQSKDPYCSPLFATDEQLKSLPPTMLITCEKDPLNDEGERYGMRLVQNGVLTTMIRYPGMLHGFTEDPSLEASQDAYQMMANYLENYLNR